MYFVAKIDPRFHYIYALNYIYAGIRNKSHWRNISRAILQI